MGTPALPLWGRTCSSSVCSCIRRLFLGKARGETHVQIVLHSFVFCCVGAFSYNPAGISSQKLDWRSACTCLKMAAFVLLAFFSPILEQFYLGIRYFLFKTQCFGEIGVPRPQNSRNTFGLGANQAKANRVRPPSLL